FIQLLSRQGGGRSATCDVGAAAGRKEERAVLFRDVAQIGESWTDGSHDGVVVPAQTHQAPAFRPALQQLCDERVTALPAFWSEVLEHLWMHVVFQEGRETSAIQAEERKGTQHAIRPLAHYK